MLYWVLYFGDELRMFLKQCHQNLSTGNNKTVSAHVYICSLATCTVLGVRIKIDNFTKLLAPVITTVYAVFE